MRPHTLTEVAERVADGEPFDKALDEFLDAFYAAPTSDDAAARIAREPAATGIPFVAPVWPLPPRISPSNTCAAARPDGPDPRAGFLQIRPSCSTTRHRP